MSEMCLQNDVKLLVSDVLHLMKEKWNHTVYDFKCDGLDYRILQRDKTVTWNIPTKTPQFLSSQKYEKSHLIWSFIIIHADVRVIKVILHPKKSKFSRHCTPWLLSYMKHKNNCLSECPGCSFSIQWKEKVGCQAPKR